MHSNKTAADRLRLRRGDVKIALILLAVISGLLVLTLEFPMSGSYGGVENQWFVSPALFPLIVLSVLFGCTVILLYRAVRDGGATRFFALRTWTGTSENEVSMNRWFILFLLSAYVYIYIPSLDFYLATVIFLISLATRFYLQYESLNRVFTLTHTLLIVAVIFVHYLTDADFSMFTPQASSNENAIRYNDGLAFATISFFFILIIKHPNKAHKKIIHTILWTLISPLILVITFNFFLFIPMPVEYGSVMRILNFIVYDWLNV